MLKPGILLTGVLTIFVVAGCTLLTSDNSFEPLEEEPYITGEITQIEELKYGVRILVEEDPDVDEASEPGGTKIWLSLSNSEVLVQQPEGSLSKASVEALWVGQTVEGWPTGPIDDSYPQQGGAKRIVIVK